jgi:hypothetical protein
MSRLLQTITYQSPLDALIAVVKRLSLYENQHKLDSEEFFHQYRQGKISDEIEFIEWADDYQHYLALRQEIEQDLSFQNTNDWLEEAEARDRDLTSGEVIGYPASQVFADLHDYLKNLEDYEEKLVRGEIQDYTVKINQED